MGLGSIITLFEAGLWCFLKSGFTASFYAMGARSYSQIRNALEHLSNLPCSLLKQMSEQASAVKAWWMSLLRS